MLAGYFWKTNSGSAIRKVMVLLAFSTGMWVIFTGTFTYRWILLDYFDLGISFVYFFGILFLTALLHLVILFPHKIFPFDRLHTVLLYIPTLILGFAAFTPAIIKENITPSSGYTTSYPGPAHWMFNSYLFLMYAMVIILLIVKIKRFDGFSRDNAKTLLWGIILGGLPIVFLDLVLTTLGIYPNAAVASLFTVVWLGFTTYIIVRK